MGRIRTAEIKRASFSLVSRYTENFTEDFERNKTVLNELKLPIESKHVRNRLAGYTARIVKKSHLKRGASSVP